jgi:uncharacterized protein
MLAFIARALALLAFLGWLGAAAAETELAPPLPTPDEPRKVVLQLASDDPRQVNDLLFNVVNIQKFYGQDNVRVAVVSYGAGNRALYKETSPVRARIESLLQYEVAFLACGNTMEATQHSRADLIDGVAVVTAGLPEIIERQLQGWIVVRP